MFNHSQLLELVSANKNAHLLSPKSSVLKPGLRWLIQATMITLIFFLTGCASLPTDYSRSTSTAFQEYEKTMMGMQYAEEAAKHPGESGFTIIRYGHTAFSSRIAMTRLAEKTLDVQYYIWESDETGQILAEHLVRAAERGVRVRLLVDDMNINGRDAIIASLDVHPNIEIRIFNPFSNRTNSMFDFVTDFGRVNHRMHNKIMVMDNNFAIVGGRNIGDHYFSVNPETNFRDLDIAAAGPIVREISSVFDRFWNGDWAVPIDVLVDRAYTNTDLQRTLTKLQKNIAEGNYPYSTSDDIAMVTNNLSAIKEGLIWAPGRVVWDDPSSVKDGVMVNALFEKLQSLQRELIIESAYFVVGERGLEATKLLRERGIIVRVLTNSLSSNDVLAAHAGHAKYRKQLLKMGIEIYEIRTDSGVIRKNWAGESMAALHTKALVFDGESIFIGSFNLDPRSANINTEAGIYVDSPELASQVLAYMNEGVSPENSYQVLLDENGELYWVTEDAGVEIRHDQEPDTTFGQRLKSGIIMNLPIESQL